MSVTIILGFLAGGVFLAMLLSLAIVGYQTRDLQFRSRMAAPTPAVGRRGWLVNVRVPADRAQPVRRT